MTEKAGSSEARIPARLLVQQTLTRSPASPPIGTPVHLEATIGLAGGAARG